MYSKALLHRMPFYESHIQKSVLSHIQTSNIGSTFGLFSIQVCDKYNFQMFTCVSSQTHSFSLKKNQNPTKMYSSSKESWDISLAPAFYISLFFSYSVLIFGSPFLDAGAFGSNSLLKFSRKMDFISFHWLILNITKKNMAFFSKLLRMRLFLLKSCNPGKLNILPLQRLFQCH